MFSNKFNTRNDPLLEAVQGAMQDGDLRRQAQAYVNEQFGVYNRNAVVRENLAAYDAALEEAYKCMKEGKPLDPVGQEDDDINNNGKKNDKSDKYLLNRRKTIGRAMGKKSLEELSHETLRQYSSRAVTDPSRSAGVELATSKIMGMGHAKVPAASPPSGIPMNEESKDYLGSSTVTKSAPKEDPSTPKVPYSELPKTGNRAGSVIDSAKGALKEDQLDELKQSTIRSYIDKAHARMGAAKTAGFKKGDSYEEKKGPKAAKARAEFAKRGRGLGLAGKKLAEETIEEAVSRKHFQQVADLIKGHESQEKRNELASHHASIFAKQNPRFDHARFHKAAGSTAHDEPKKMEEAVYSAKAARAGKDIGKKGKEFEKIAKSAAKRYGSEERGKAVAGKILARIRAKHMEEATQIDELSAFGQAFRDAGGKNFTFGGKSYSGARADNKSTSTSASSTPGTQGVATGKSFSAIDRAQAAKAKSGPADNPGLRGSTMPKTPGTVARDTGVTGKPSGETGVASDRTVSLDRPGNPGASPSAAPAPAPKPNAPAPSTSSSTPSGARSTTSSGLVGPDAAKMMTPSRPAPSAPVTSQPGAPKDDASAGVKKLMSMNESVQVGDNKYRIV